jgi:hypothetical protein
LPPLPGKQAAFKGEDYSAPTSFLDPASLRGDRPVNFKKPLPISNKRNKRNRPLIAPTITLIVVVLLAMGLLGYQAFQASILANISISPHVKTMSNVFMLTAKPELKNIDAGSSSIPAGVLTSTQTSLQQGETTGKTNCTLGIFDCQQAVSPDDSQALSLQIWPKLRSKIDQDLQKQAHDAGATMVGNTIYSNETITSNPQVDTASNTVTVTVTKRGSIEYFKAKDVDDLALLLLKQKLDQHYELIDSLTRVDKPVVQQVDQDGTVQIAVAAGGVARYQMPASELADIQNHIKGLTQKNALVQIAKDGNIDPNAIGIHISYGNTVPNNVQQIKIGTINPSNLPAVELTPLSSP